MRRFWDKVKKTDDCWLWQGGTNDDGYGLFYEKRKCLRAHRVAFRLHFGREPGEVLRHRCDNPPCVNPEHLLEGTHADNVRDKVERGRTTKGRHLGEAHPRAVLTEDLVREARKRREAGQTVKHIAADLGVSIHTLHDVLKGKTWAHVK